ncbi:hypothetical protein V6N11_038955 [Hibiscus sabdariffa]|uniref:Uncharacterized protein n=1 Tax=Hibiscus sabdariffa TaxID=183260 RepID=A0ABR2SMC4_9ROSI
MEVWATTAVPVKGKAWVKFRWGLRIPSEMKSGSGRIADPKTGISKSGPNTDPNSDAKEAYYTIKRYLEALQSVNGSLKSVVEEFRHEISLGKYGNMSWKHREIERNGISKQKTEREETMRRNQSKIDRENIKKKLVEVNLSEELKKALKGAVGS